MDCLEKNVSRKYYHQKTTYTHVKGGKPSPLLPFIGEIVWPNGWGPDSIQPGILYLGLWLLQYRKFCNIVGSQVSIMNQ